MNRSSTQVWNSGQPKFSTEDTLTMCASNFNWLILAKLDTMPSHIYLPANQQP